MDFLAIAGVPALAAWGVSVGHRCTTERAQAWLLVLDIALAIMLALAVLIGGKAVFWALISAVIAVVFVELLFVFNVIPSARDFRNLFDHLPLDLRIIMHGGHEVYRTAVARDLDADTLARLASANSKSFREGVLTVRDESIPHTVFKLYQLQAGVALLTEDAAEYDRLQEQLEFRRDQLTHQNEMLLQSQAMQGLLYRQQRERELYECVERDLAEATEQIRSILDDLQIEGSEGSTAANIEQLAMVKILVAYCKRKGMLALVGANSETMSQEQIEAITRESMADLRSVGVECAVLVAVDAPVTVAVVNTIYDSFYDCVLSVLPYEEPTLMVYLQNIGEKSMRMRVGIECAIGLNEDSSIDLISPIATSTASWDAVQESIACDLERRLGERGVYYSAGREDGLVNVTIEARGDADGDLAATSAGDAR